MSRVPGSGLALHDNLLKADALMRSHGVRYLPVLESGRPVGLLSERDLNLAEALAQDQWRDVLVGDVMSAIPYCTDPDEAVDQVAHDLSLRKADAALVMAGNRIVGIFTHADALSLLAQLVRAGGEALLHPARASSEQPDNDSTC